MRVMYVGIGFFRRGMLIGFDGKVCATCPHVGMQDAAYICHAAVRMSLDFEHGFCMSDM